MKKFNLLQIIPSLNSGGVEQGTLDLANYLSESNTKNLIISNGGSMLSYLNKKNVHHYKLPVHSKNFFKMPFIAKKINEIIMQNNINILHVRSRAPSWILPYINKKKLVTVSTFHNVYGHQNVFKRIYNKGLSNTKFIVAISEYVKEEIVNHYNIDPKKITVINRGIDTNFYDAKINNENQFINFIDKYNIPSDKKIILYPGRLTNWKGQIEFLNIIEKLKNEHYFFYFVGDNKNHTYTNKLLKIIEKKHLTSNCKVLNHLNKDNLKMMYQCADLVVSMPVKPEGFGRIISESIAMKKIIIADNVGGAYNQLKNLDPIYKINSRDPDELINKINFILKLDPEKLLEIKNISRKHVEDKFSRTGMLKNYVSFYEEISS